MANSKEQKSGGKRFLAQTEDGVVETELKLTARLPVLKKILSLPVIRDRTVGKLAKHHLRSAYYDTNDRRIQNRGLALRVRTIDNRFIQTVKERSSKDGVVAVRKEWSKSLTNAKPTLKNFSSPDLLDRMGLVLESELETVFVVDVERTTLKINQPNGTAESAVIELALDTGTIRTGDQTDVISELELELLEGKAVALYRLALTLVEQFHVGLETRSKSDRGYALASGDWPVADTSRPTISFDKNVLAKNAFEHILVHVYADLVANKSASYVGRDIEGVHQLRVSLRRIRTALSLFKTYLPPDICTWLDSETSWLMDTFGTARNIDVFLSETLANVESDFPADEELLEIRRVAEIHREKCYYSVRQTLDHFRFNSFLLRLGLLGKGPQLSSPSFGNSEELNRPLVDLADRFLNKLYKRVRKLGRQLESASTEERHKLRIAVKKLRYTAEFCSSLYGKKKTSTIIKLLKRLQTNLGAANDVTVAEHLLSELINDADPKADQDKLQRARGKILGWHRHAQQEEQAHLIEQWMKFTQQSKFWA